MGPRSYTSPMRPKDLLRPALLAFLLLAAGLPVPSSAGAETVVRPRLDLVPLDGAPVRLAFDEWDQLPRQTVQVEFPAGHVGQPGKAEVSGIPLRALLTRMGVPEGRDFHGPWLRRVAVIEAADGYKVVFALAELDPGYSADLVLLVDRRDGKAIAQEEGPLRLIAPADRHPARWVRQVVRIAVREVP
jgi:hypothetical protein